MGSFMPIVHFLGQNRIHFYIYNEKNQDVMNFRTVVTILISGSLFWTACDSMNKGGGQGEEAAVDSAVVAERQRIEAEKKALEEEKAEFSRQLQLEEERKRKDDVLRLAQHASRFSLFSEAVVVSSKCFFHSRPEENSVKKSYLVEGDRVMVSKIQRHYVFVDFYSEYSGKTTSGWLNTQDLEPVILR
jgi:hypothetical protein